MIKSQQRFQFTLKGVRCKANSVMTIHTLADKLTGSHTIVILFTTQCQLYIWGQSHPFSSIVAIVYKLQWNPCYFTLSLYSNVTTSTRINSSSVHMYICVCFIRNQYNTSSSIQHWVCWPNNATWCQNRGCICISSTRRTYRSNPADSYIHPSILNNSTM